MPCSSGCRKSTNCMKTSSRHAFACLTRMLLNNSRSQTALIRWNASMSIRDILDQLDGTYGKPDTMVLLTNNTLFRSLFNPAGTPDLLLYTGSNSARRFRSSHATPYYSDTQVINNAVRLSMQSSTFPLKEFDVWEAITPKTYPALKTLICGAYTRCILAMQLCNTAGQLGHAESAESEHAQHA
jgi:hypothetical protein